MASEIHDSIILIEHDNGHLNELTQNVISWVKARAKEYIKIQGAQFLVAALADPEPITKIGLLVAAAFVYYVLPEVLDKVINWFVELWEDNIFAPFVLEILIGVSKRAGCYSDGRLYRT